jgi:hypothetical protein
MQRIFGNTPMRIARETDTPVLLLRPEGHPVEFGLGRALDYLRGGYAEVDDDSRQRLEDQGYIVQRPAGAAGGLKSSVNEPVMLVIGILTLAAAVMMFAGDGGTLTWIGVIVYFVMLVAFTVLSMRTTGRSTALASKKPAPRTMAV